MARSSITRRTSILASIAVVIAVAIGADARAQESYRLSKIAAQDACALLTANDIAMVLHDSVTWSSAGSGGPTAASACSYSTANHADIELSIAGGRAEFEKLPSELPGMTRLSGVGDAGYNGPPSTGGSGAGGQVFVLKGGTYFSITVQSDSGDAADFRSAAALARKVADRIKGR
jgi:hypothetical protein